MRNAYFFFYGTLQAEHIPGFFTIGEGYTKGQLISIDGRYPGLINGSGIVYGTIYRALPGTPIDTFDRYEGYNPHNLEQSLYRRELRDVCLVNKEDYIRCWVYLFNQDSTEYTLIKSGNWLIHQHLGQQG